MNFKELLSKVLIKDVFADSARFDPLKNFKFAVSFTWVDGSTLMGANFGFNKVSGLKMDTEVIEYREGGDNLSVRKLAGLINSDAITFEKGITEDTDMWNAFIKMFDATGASDRSEASSVDTDGYRGTITIDIQNRKGDSVRKYEISKAWISSYEVGDLDAQGNNVLVEKITLQNEGFTRVA